MKHGYNEGKVINLISRYSVNFALFHGHRQYGIDKKKLGERLDGSVKIHQSLPENPNQTNLKYLPSEDRVKTQSFSYEK